MHEGYCSGDTGSCVDGINEGKDNDDDNDPNYDEYDDYDD